MLTQLSAEFIFQPFHLDDIDVYVKFDGAIDLLSNDSVGSTGYRICLTDFQPRRREKSVERVNLPCDLSQFQQASAPASIATVCPMLSSNIAASTIPAQNKFISTPVSTT